MENLSARLKKAPVIGGLWQFAELRPRLAAWIVLSLGIVILLLVEARDVGLLIGQWIALIVASILVAGLCIWIVSWEDSDEVPAKGATAPAAPVKVEAPPVVPAEPGQTPPAAPQSS